MDMSDEMDVNSMTLRILSRSGFYEDGGENGEFFWTEMHYYKNQCGRKWCEEAEDDEWGDDPDFDGLFVQETPEEETEDEFFECWDYWHQIGSL
jgi:hypothetical protein